MSYLNLEHKLLEVFKKNSFGRDLIVSVSGGLDSMVLLSSLQAIQKQLGLNLIVGYVHHGPTEDSGQKEFRDSCYSLIKKHCELKKIKFISNTKMPELPLKSEDDFRSFRLKVYESWLQEFVGCKIVLGHHKNDVLENQLIQLIRGW